MNHDTAFIISLLMLLVCVGLFGTSSSTIPERMFYHGMTKREALMSPIVFFMLIIVMAIVTVALLPA